MLYALDSKMTPQKRIMKNLKDRVHGVNFAVATQGPEGALVLAEALRDLVSSGIVVRTIIDGYPLFSIDPYHKFAPYSNRIKFEVIKGGKE